jgi:predicted nucleic acid-binding protein
MRYLLDVNTLIALGVVEHEFHALVAAWVGGLRTNGTLELLTCSITELGFVRILAQSPTYRFTTTTARSLLLRMKIEDKALFAFLADSNDIPHLPGWVKHPKQITDGHLMQLARANGAVLATLDRGIPGAFLIPAKS